MPEALNQTKDHCNKNVQVRPFGQKGIMRDTLQLPMPLRLCNGDEGKMEDGVVQVWWNCRYDSSDSSGLLWLTEEQAEVNRGVLVSPPPMGRLQRGTWIWKDQEMVGLGFMMRIS